MQKQRVININNIINTWIFVCLDNNIISIISDIDLDISECNIHYSNTTKKQYAENIFKK